MQIADIERVLTALELAHENRPDAEEWEFGPIPEILPSAEQIYEYFSQADEGFFVVTQGGGGTCTVYKNEEAYTEGEWSRYKEEAKSQAMKRDEFESDIEDELEFFSVAREQPTVSLWNADLGWYVTFFRDEDVTTEKRNGE